VPRGFGRKRWHKPTGLWKMENFVKLSCHMTPQNWFFSGGGGQYVLFQFRYVTEIIAAWLYDILLITEMAYAAFVISDRRKISALKCTYFPTAERNLCTAHSDLLKLNIQQIMNGMACTFWNDIIFVRIRAVDINRHYLVSFSCCVMFVAKFFFTVSMLNFT